VRRSAQVRKKLIEAYRASGLGKAAFCRSHRLPLATFCNWLRRAPATCTFAEVQVKPPTWAVAASEHGVLLEVALPKGIHLRVRDPAALAVVLPVVRELARC